MLFEHSSDAHLIFDDDGILDCNSAAIEMLRCRDKSEVLTLHPAELSPELQPDGRRSLEKCVEMDRLAHERGFHRFEWIHRRMTGEDFPVQVTLTPVQLASGPALVVVWHELTILREHERRLARQADAIADQQRTILRLSTPILEVADGVLLAPIVGAVDQARATSLISAALDAIQARGARRLIVDLTGVDDFDASTAAHLVRLCAAAALLGARAILSGINPALAQRIIALPTDLRAVETAATTCEAIGRDR